MGEKWISSLSGIPTDKLYITDAIPHSKVISDQPIIYRQNTGRKVLLFLSFFFTLLFILPWVSAWQMNLYHPILQHKVPLSTLDPEYLWKHLDDPVFQRYNDMSQIQEYLRTMNEATHQEPRLSKGDLQRLSLRQIYNPYTHQFVHIDSLSPSEIQTFLRENSGRIHTLTQPLRPMTLKAYYQEKMHPKTVIQKKSAFRNSQLCIIWMDHGRIVRQIPPHCDP